MSMESFPNELLELVLKDVCEIDEQVFEFAYERNWRPQTAAARIAPLQALLVCRSWHSLAFSLFYRTVILSTVVHARHFARILNGHPNIANHVRKIFFNGGFGATAAKSCRRLRVSRIFASPWGSVPQTALKVSAIHFIAFNLVH
jgi:hypothetical protein